MGDIRIALMSAVMKVFVRLVLRRLQVLVRTFTDPLQFAYSRNRSVEDAVVLNNIYSHLDSAVSYVRLMFFDFSSAFNTIQPHIMSNKLLSMELDYKTVVWIYE
ncbi:hypothetical protein BaRGS_00035242 [Batillaria attramentaria]|uniref:Reverse transcriptase domain-containing protein n=1 Tax=Batillaria attramentaria TaxID=370345 RepID=A0ABD0JF18_9CAEN